LIAKYSSRQQPRERWRSAHTPRTRIPGLLVHRRTHIRLAATLNQDLAADVHLTCLYLDASTAFRILEVGRARSFPVSCDGCNFVHIIGLRHVGAAVDVVALDVVVAVIDAAVVPVATRDVVSVVVVVVVVIVFVVAFVVVVLVVIIVVVVIAVGTIPFAVGIIGALVPVVVFAPYFFVSVLHTHVPVALYPAPATVLLVIRTAVHLLPGGAACTLPPGHMASVVEVPFHTPVDIVHVVLVVVAQLLPFCDGLGGAQEEVRPAADANLNKLAVVDVAVSPGAFAGRGLVEGVGSRLAAVLLSAVVHRHRDVAVPQRAREQFRMFRALALKTHFVSVGLVGQHHFAPLEARLVRRDE